ncbi:pilus assembly protein TadG-related protein [Loktanella sp. TSTF-M6]|uniref:Pilus assembly protein TadG-related protein n=1 Tax=Loktanella gaetbuli TaxID=2881335 RepID=A0ABS8BY14_9RHOB|nr:TadG family pilus assembly protein [Loktanella gaetbuli]MCB5200632.1 pilus assembly protein TadG-related protein [Loktanella gaetbuli]
MSPIDRIMTRFARDEDGAVAVIVALVLTMLLGFVAFGVDIGALYRERASLQATSDLTAMSAMGDPTAATARAQVALGANGRDAATLTDLQPGRFLRNPAIAPEQRFTPLPAGSPGINAIAVTLTDDAPLYFAQIFTDEQQVSLTGRALATRTGAASFSLTSHVARLDGLDLNRGIMRRFGTTQGLTQGNMNDLAAAQVRIGDLVLGIDSSNPNPAAILDGTATDVAVIRALRDLVPTPGWGALSPVVNSASDAPFDMTQLISSAETDLGLTLVDFLNQIEMPALDVLRGLVGSGQTRIDPIVTSDIEVPGLTAISARIVAGEPPAQSGWIAIGEAGTQLHRAAARLTTDISLSAGTLGLIGTGVSAGEIKLPLMVELAGSTATLDDISCMGTDPDTVIARFRTSHTPLHPGNGTSVAALYLGTLPAGTADSTTINPASLDYADLLDLTIRVAVPLLPDIVVSGITVQARSNVTVGQSQVDSIAFTRADLAAGRTTASYGSGQVTRTAIADLLSPDNLELRVKPGDAGLVSGLVAPVLDTVMAALPGQILTALTDPLDGIVDGIIAPTGLQLGAGELALTGHHCELIRLVQ